jgi:hypothetical protein
MTVIECPDDESPQQAAKRQSSGLTEGDVIARLVREGKVVTTAITQGGVDREARVQDELRTVERLLGHGTDADVEAAVAVVRNLLRGQ